jgi:hypothetical protein
MSLFLREFEPSRLGRGARIIKGKSRVSGVPRGR